jgi:hypothetical protein
VELEREFAKDGIIRLSRYRSKADTISTIKKLFADSEQGEE